MQEYRHEATGEICREYTIAGGQDRRELRQALGSANGQTLIRQVRVGRNEPCPCESGKKFKKCCIDRVGRYNSV